MSTYEAIKQRYTKAGQEHVLHFYEELSEAEQGALLEQLDTIDVAELNGIFKTAVEAEKATPDTDSISIEPPPASSVESLVADPNKASGYRERGLNAIKEGQVAVILLAGGQGTRLGSSAPKGAYDIKLPSGKSLFQLQGERIKRLQTLASGVLTWYVMTSGPTRKATEAFFVEHNYFGLAAQNVVFFQQGVLPCLTDDGKIFLETKSHVAVAPDGNGGIYAALRAPLETGKEGTVLSDMASRGIRYLHAYCVDNCLAKVADPVFVGYCIHAGAECGTKTVVKTHPDESVGVVALKNGKFNVIEYSEIPKELAARKDGNQLAFRAANIANHFYTLEFLEKIASFQKEMAYHVARKKIPHVSLENGREEKPSKPNGMKLELFIFDVLPFTEKMALLEVERKDEFSPLKNAPGSGSDCPETSRADLLNQQKRWLEAAGAKLGDKEIEVSPLMSYEGEDLERLKGLIATTSGLLETQEDIHKLFE
ncbi:uncharacterized protein L969DRAFT_50461 [Mixia osmundae IAM 14324]|uniref:UDP-N-acetylglucosamine diphosphorylase n=1 Tax=Mixia osmundae (strain CBS 9802 / IAM 14324 / JCM 22182 / KY 12970) TaxID=764103 RepID=G7E1Z0_MIXOS|nr:uncharacterized protein L969DRAFT_50461 [Mixia osmundae IAM 14324]KEI38717.1 hypothetical protein L969DRAFT_50461 [Mixia osmundae IAM 14324]GAA96827.1 hypothetical protein E5Q_03499 [Mixia osmundae IAM 14324]